MSRPRFLADEDLRGSIVRAARRMPPVLEISMVAERRLASADDGQVLEFAWRERWILVSHDVNTLKAIAEDRVAHGHGVHGVFLVPQNRATSQVAQ